MTADEDIERFVKENRELVERMMRVRRDNIQTASELGKDAIISSRKAAEFVRTRSEDLARAAYGMVSDPTVQGHFIRAGMEFMAGLTALAKVAPVPDFMKGAAADLQKNARSVACRFNEDCPARAVTVRTEAE